VRTSIWSRHVLSPKTSAGAPTCSSSRAAAPGDQVVRGDRDAGAFRDLQASGQLERLLRSGAGSRPRPMVLSAVADDAALKIAVRGIGPALVFERLWEETGCRRGDRGAGGQTQHGFELERAVFLTVLQLSAVPENVSGTIPIRQPPHSAACDGGFTPIAGARHVCIVSMRMMRGAPAAPRRPR